MFQTQLPGVSSFRQSRQQPVNPTQPQPGGTSAPPAQPAPMPPAPTFAELQQQGRARPPAPTGGMPAPAMAPAGAPSLPQQPFPQMPGMGTSPTVGDANPPAPAPTTPTAGTGGTGSGYRLTPPSGPTDTQPGSTTGPIPTPGTTPSTFGGDNGTASTNGLPLQGDITQAILAMLHNGSSYNSDAVQNEYKQLSQQIDDQYSLGQKSINDNLAQRGLGAVGDSTVGLGKLSDLNVGRKTAQEQAASDLITKQATARDQSITQALQAALGLGNLSVNQQQGGLSALLAYLNSLASGGAATPAPTGA